MKALFIAGTDTGVGKTVVTGCLARFLREKGFSVATQKWIQAGPEDDVRRHCQMARLGPGDRGLGAFLAPYRFQAACSPHLAARLEKRPVRKDRIKKSFNALSSRFDFVLVEGTGGLLVPFNTKETVADIVRELRIPVLLVAANKLGAINHTLLALEALGRRKTEILGVVFSNAAKENRHILNDNPSIVARLSGKPVLGVLRRSSPGRIYRNFFPIADKIWRRLS